MDPYRVAVGGDREGLPRIAHAVGPMVADTWSAGTAMGPFETLAATVSGTGGGPAAAGARSAETVPAGVPEATDSARIATSAAPERRKERDE